MGVGDHGGTGRDGGPSDNSDDPGGDDGGDTGLRANAGRHAASARHALSVLTLLAGRAAPLPAATIARELGLPRSSTYHLLAVMREEGYIAHVPEERRYGLGVAVVELGSGYARQQPLQRLARPLLARLAERSGHNTHLAVLHGRDVLYVVEERVPGRPSLVSDIGVRLPATLTASGLAILAALPAAQVRALFPDESAFVQRNGAGPTSLTALRSELSKTRQHGFAEEIGSVTPGLASVAAAAIDHNGHPVAGVAITMPHADAGSGAAPDTAPDPDHRVRLAEMAKQCAAEVSARLGYRGGTEGPA